VSHRSIAHIARIATFACTFGIASSVLAQAVPPDEIRTRDGGLYRGVILENVPGDHLTILLANGESRRIEAADVEYAGAITTTVALPTAPAASDSQSTTSGPAPLVDQGGLRISVSTSVPGLTLHGGLQGARLERICVGSCELRVSPGNHRFVIEDESGRRRPVQRSLFLDRDGRLEMSLRSRQSQRRGLRSVGVLVALASIAPFVILAKGCDDDFDDCSSNGATRIAGPALLLGGLGFIALSFAVHDDGRVVFTPNP
jgi:hypothetical protein